MIQISTTSDYERRAAITRSADLYQDRVLASVDSGGFEFDWRKIFDSVQAHAPSDVGATIERMIEEETRSDSFVQTDAAVILNGEMIARWSQARHEDELRPRAPIVRQFAEPRLYNPEQALEYWQSILDLSDAEVELIRDHLLDFQSSTFALRQGVSVAAMNRIAELIDETLHIGLPVSEFIRRGLEVMPKATAQILSTEYRTRLTQSYGGVRLRQVIERRRTFPFIQYMAIKDGRTTWWICLPISMAGPGGTGFIAASDDIFWAIWTPPNHYQCRSDLSPISYLEAQRLGILSSDGVTRIALVGSNVSRPFGEPPRFAKDPHSGTLRAVTPAPGFA